MATQNVTPGVRYRWFVSIDVALTLGLFAVACFLPTVNEGRYTDGGALHDGPYEGPDVGVGFIDLLFGWLSGHPAWFANPILFVALVLLLMGRRASAAVAGILAVSLGITTWATFGMRQLYAGYYVWQASQLVFAGGAWWAWLQERRSRTG